MAMIAGIFYGSSFIPVFYIKDHGRRNGTIYVGASQFGKVIYPRRELWPFMGYRREGKILHTFPFTFLMLLASELLSRVSCPKINCLL